MIQQHVLAPSTRAAILAHYERAAVLIAANFPLAPVVWVAYPHGLDKDAVYSGAVHEQHPLPDSIPTVEFGGPEHPRHYPAIDADGLLWFVRHRGAVDFCSWTPSRRDPQRVGFARVVLGPRGGATPEHVSLAMLAVRTTLSDRGIESIPVLDGFAGAALFIPFNDAPAYDDVRDWLHDVADTAVSRNARLLTADQHEQKKNRVHVNVGSNAVGRLSSLPYALAGSEQLGMVTPIEWNELGIVPNGHFTAMNSAVRLAQGDVFQRLATELATQRFGDCRR